MAFKFSPLQKAWLAALKSGKFRQTKQRLAERDQYRHNKYCCLGVACEVANRMGVVKLVKKEDDDGEISYDNESASLPAEMVKALGLNCGAGELYEAVEDSQERVADCLAELNDNLGWSFKKIAAYIKKNPENVFKK